MTISIENWTDTNAATWAVWHSWDADKPTHLEFLSGLAYQQPKKCQTANVAACISVRFLLLIVTDSLTA